MSDRGWVDNIMKSRYIGQTGADAIGLVFVRNGDNCIFGPFDCAKEAHDFKRQQKEWGFDGEIQEIYAYWMDPGG